MKIACKTLFDCSATGVTGSYRPAQVPFKDRVGQQVENEQDWHHSRNQQRNWETLLQVFGLRTQPEVTIYPHCCDGFWYFEFETATEGIYDIGGNSDPLAGLRLDCQGVPMVVNLHERSSVQPTLVTHGPNQNIWFEAINS